ncbi:hypothetical protein D3C78_1291950 [compost metagenome]
MDSLARQSLKLILLDPAQHERTNGISQLPAQLTSDPIALSVRRIQDRLYPVVAELAPATQQAWLSGIHQAPEISQAVLHWRTCRQQLEVRLQPFCCSSLHGVRVLDVLRLIKDHHPPVNHAQRELVVAQCLVGRQYQSPIHVQTMGTGLRANG